MKTRILNLISEHIALENSYINEHDQIKSILKPLDGQPINGRTLNTKRLSAFEVTNGYPFKFKAQYGMFYIIGKYEHLIGYNSEPIIKLSDSEEYGKRGFGYFDNCHNNAAKDRIYQLQCIDIDKMTEVFTAIETNFNNLRVLFGDVERNKLGSFYNPVYYEILNTIYKDDTDRYKLRLSDFYFIRK
jgi:hypothetical protein